MPVSASATISASAWAASIWRRRARAGASSSAISTRIGSSFRQFDPDARARREILPAETGVLAIVAREPLGDIPQAVPVAGAVDEPGAVVHDLDAQPPAGEGGADGHDPAALDGRHAVLDRVLDERLDAHRGHLDRARRGVARDLDAQALAEAGLLHAQVGGHELHLLLEARPFLFRFAERVAEDLRELLDRLLGQRGLVVDEPGDGVQRVEQEMRVDLGAEGL